MPEKLTSQPQPSAGTELETALALAVLAVPGVVRLEPSLTQAVAALRTRHQMRPTVQVRRRGGEVRLVRTDVVVDDSRSATATAADVRAALRARLGPDVRVEVAVLGVESR